MNWQFGAFLLGGYTLGSIPFGLLAAKLCRSQDPRTAGSGNIGFTNVLRVSGKKAGTLTLVGDFGKGFLVVWLAKRFLTQESWILAIAFAVIVGHIFSVFLVFHGGKGVATALGSILGLEVLLGGILILTWGVVAGLWKYSSGAALVSFSLFPVFTILMGYSGAFLWFSCVVSLLVISRHKDNILRLIQGTEGKMGHFSS